MPLYVSDFYGSLKVQGLTWWERGLYLDLLAREWTQNGRGLPPIDELERAMNPGSKRPRQFRDGLTAVLRRFFHEIGGRWFNQRVENVLKDCVELRKSRSEGGKKTVLKRWPKDSSATAALGDGDGNGSSSPRNQEDLAAASALVTGGVQGGKNGNGSGGVLDRLMVIFGFGVPRAQGLIEQLGYTLPDLDAWVAFANAKSWRLAKHLMKSYRNPDEIPEDRTAPDPKSRVSQLTKTDPYQQNKFDRFSDAHIQSRRKNVPS